ncbi:MAG: amidohydrolase family protein, partial [Candidatus Binatia bacterium]
PRQTQVFVDKSKSHPAAEGRSLGELAKAKGVHPVEVMCELVVGDGLDTQLVYNSEGPEWIAANGESQRNPHMIVGTGDGGAHADRDDGAEWSTYFLRSWVLDRQHYTLEEGVRRITHLPAMICGIPLRGLLARGYHADVMLFDPARLRLGKKGLVHDMPGGEARWQVKPEGVVRVLVNGQTIVENGALRDGTPGRVLRIGNSA